MFTLILKGTNGCNLNCSYCSLGEKKNFKYVSEKELISILEYVCDICISINDDLNVILHGGEPTLVPVEIYRSAFSYVKDRYRKLNIKISMQTNAYVLTDEYLNFIKEFDVSVGVSIDGEKKIHNKERCDKNGNATYDRVASNIEKLQVNDIQPSCLMVLTHIGLEASLDYLNYFANKNIHLKINPLLNYGEALKNEHLYLKSGEYANYLIKAFEYIIENKINISISPVDKILHAVISDERIRECTFDKACNKKFLSIDFEGNIYPCGKFSDMSGNKLGSVYTDSYIENILPKINKLINRRTSNLPTKCLSCDYRPLCNAGCSAEVYIEGYKDNIPKLCEDYKMLFEYFKSTGLVLLRNALIEQKKSLVDKYNEIRDFNG